MVSRRRARPTSSSCTCAMRRRRSWSKLCLRQADARAAARAWPTSQPTTGMRSMASQDRQRAPRSAPSLSSCTSSASSAACSAALARSQAWRAASPDARTCRYRAASRDCSRATVSASCCQAAVRVASRIIGVLRAMREAGIVIDAVGGTSIGAVIAAGYASEWSDEELRMRMRRSFVDTNPGQRLHVAAGLAGVGPQGERVCCAVSSATSAIEDLPLPFFCVSTNLSSGQLGRASSRRAVALVARVGRHSRRAAAGRATAASCSSTARRSTICRST